MHSLHIPPFFFSIEILFVFVLAKQILFHEIFVESLIIGFSLASYAYKFKRFVSYQPHEFRTTFTIVSKICQSYRYIMTTTTPPGQQYIRLDDIDVLNQLHCKIKHPERVEQIINEIIKGGSSELQVVTDFDFTLTKQKTDNGKPVLSSFGMFNKCKSLPSNFVDESNKLYEKYRPIEICPRITQDEKKKHMIEWWELSSDILK